MTENTRNGRLKLIWQLVYIFGTLVLIYLLGFSDPEFVTLFSGGLVADARWLWLCGAAMLGFWLLQSLVYAYTGTMTGGRISLWANLRITMFGEYYSAITPFASGGQPMQLGYYRRYGVNAAIGSSILAVRYIGFVSSICLCFLCALVVEGARIYAEYPVVFWLTTVGFLINFLSILGVALLLLRAPLVRRIGLWVVRQLTRLPFLRAKRESWNIKFEKGVVEFSGAAECIRAHPWRCAVVLGLSIASVFCLFSVSYLVYRALGLTSAGYSELFSMQIFLYLAVAFAPTPGAVGATEGGFYLFFAMVFPKNLLYAAMLLWRLFTYYSNLLLGAALIVGDEVAAMRRRRRKDMES